MDIRKIREMEKMGKQDTIDFSAKKDFKIKHKDGNVTPMDEPYYEVTQIAPDTWQIMSSGDYHYLVAGDKEAVSIDTGYGAGNLRTFLEELCGKPVKWAINTHSHFDHSANDAYFDLVFMGKDGVDKAAVAYPSFDGITFPRDFSVCTVEDGDIIPLEGRELEILTCEDHTDDGIMILDKKEKLLFVGDEIMPGGKMISGSIKKFNRDFKKLYQRYDEFDKLCGGNKLLEKEEVEIFYEASELILQGKGEMEEMGKRPPMRKPEESDPKLYDCQHPHKEDVPGGRPGDKGPRIAPSAKGILIHRDRRFMYSMNILDEETHPLSADEVYTSREILPRVYQITESCFYGRPGVKMYLVVGKEKAALIDSGFGVCDTLRKFVEKITDKKIICLVGHGHPDHAGAAALFDEVYMCPKDEGLLPVSLSFERRMGDVFGGKSKEINPDLYEYCCKNIVMPEKLLYKPLEGEMTFDLGDVVLETFAIPGHTQGSIAFLNRRENYALISDAFSFRSALVTLPPEKRVGITAYRDGIARFLSVINEDTVLYWGHGDEPMDHDIPKDMERACTEVLDGKTKEDIQSNSHFAKRLSAKSGKKMMEHVCGKVTLVYDANTL